MNLCPCEFAESADRMTLCPDLGNVLGREVEMTASHCKKYRTSEKHRVFWRTRGGPMEPWLWAAKPEKREGVPDRPGIKGKKGGCGARKKDRDEYTVEDMAFALTRCQGSEEEPRCPPCEHYDPKQDRCKFSDCPNLLQRCAVRIASYRGKCPLGKW